MERFSTRNRPAPLWTRFLANLHISCVAKWFNTDRVSQAVAQAKDLKKEVDLLQGSPYLHGIRRISELKNLSMSALKSLQSQLKNDLEEIEKVNVRAQSNDVFSRSWLIFGVRFRCYIRKRLPNVFCAKRIIAV